jgi:hypothetical protein
MSDIEQKNLSIAVNHKYFTSSFINFISFVKSKSNEIKLNELDLSEKANERIHRNHTKLRSVCDVLINGFKEDSDDFDQGRVIKKVYKVLTQNLDKLYPEFDKSLFTMKNEKKEIITIISGLDIGLISNMITDEDKNNVWGNMCLMYVASVGMISTINSHKKEGRVSEFVPKLKEKLLELGILDEESKLFNGYIGLSNNEEYNIKNMFESVGNLKAPTGPSMEDMFKLSGIDKLVNMDQLNEQLKNINQDDISEATDSITKLLNSEGDSDVAETCKTLIEGIVNDLHENPGGGIQSMFQTAKSVTEKLGSKLDKNKMKKTAAQVSTFMENGEANLKNLKDEHGNPIGDKLMESLQGPLKMISQMQNGKGVNMSDFAGLAQSLGSLMNNKDMFGKK